MFDSIEEAQAVMLGGIWHRLESHFDVTALVITKVLEKSIKWTDTLKNQAAFPHDLKTWMIAKAMDNEIGLTFAEEEILSIVKAAMDYLKSPIAQAAAYSSEN